jgi:hypothetical protein
MPFKKKNKKNKKKKKNLPTCLPTVKNMSRVTANIHFFKDGLSLHLKVQLLNAYLPVLFV